jgi:hypothetical protein
MPQAKLRRRDLKLKDAVRMKSAGFWLKLGEPGQALMELRKIPRSAWDHPRRETA